MCNFTLKTLQNSSPLQHWDWHLYLQIARSGVYFSVTGRIIESVSWFGWWWRADQGASSSGQMHVPMLFLSPLRLHLLVCEVSHTFLHWACTRAKSLELCPTLQPYGLKPTRILCLWDSPGRLLTGVDCHSLFQGIFLSQGSNLQLLHCRWVLYH